MITLEDVSSGKKVEVRPTIFPDKTSQVWKLDKSILKGGVFRIIWHFEEERELMDIASLRYLLTGKFVSLHMPYLPYARQDKKIRNDLTFNLASFGALINALKFKSVSAVDAHSKRAHEWIRNFTELVPPLEFLLENFERWDVVCFPDKGARSRYRWMNYVLKRKELRVVSFDKKRSSDGKIISLSMGEEGQECLRQSFKPKVLIIDDICDGGATFQMASNYLHDHSFVGRVDLYVTHGIFSKGLFDLMNSGIENIYTTDTIIGNTRRQGIKLIRKDKGGSGEFIIEDRCLQDGPSGTVPEGDNQGLQLSLCQEQQEVQ